MLIKLADRHRVRKIPLSLKLAFTAFMLVLVPFYWLTYGPSNFLYFCDVAMFFTLAAVWRESRLLASMPAVGLIVLFYLLAGITGVWAVGSRRVRERVVVAWSA